MLVVKNKKMNYPSVFDHLFNQELNSILGMDTQSQSPLVNIHEDETAYYVELAVPGISKDDISVKVEKNKLILSASTKKENETSKVNFLKKEFSYEHFNRSFTIPELADVSAIKAAYENGVLKVSLPKKPEATNASSRTITIS